MTTVVVTHFAKGHFDELTIGSISVGLNGAKIERLDAALDGTEISFQEANIDGNVILLGLSKGGIPFTPKTHTINYLEVSDFSLRLPKGEPAATAPSSEPAIAFHGVFETTRELLESLDIEVKRLKANGKIALSENQSGEFSIETKSLLSLAGTGNLDYDIGFEDIAEKLTVRITGSSDYDLRSEVTSQYVTQVKIPTFTDPLVWKWDTSLAQVSNTEVAEITIYDPSSDDQDSLVSLKSTLDWTKMLIESEIGYTLSDEGPLAKVLPVSPDFDLKGAGTIEVDLNKQNLTLNHKIQGEASKWTRIDERLEPISDIQIAQSSAITYNFDKRKGKISSFNLDVSDLSEKDLILGIDLENETILDFETAFSPEIPLSFEGLAAKIDIAGIPVEWASRFVSGLLYEGSALTGSFQITQADSVLKLNVDENVFIQDIQISQGDQSLIEDLNLVFAPVAEIDIASLKGTISQADLSFDSGSDDVTMVEIVSAIEFDLSPETDALISLSGGIDIDALEVLNQPMFDGFDLNPPEDFQKIRADLTGSIVEASVEKTEIALESLSLKISQADRPSVIDISLNQPTQVKIASGKLDTIEPKGEVGEIRLRELDYTWTDQFLSGIDLMGSALNGSFTLFSDGKGLDISSKEPIKAANFALIQDGEEKIRQLDFGFEPSASFQGDSILLQLANFNASSDGQEIISAQAELSNKVASEQEQTWIDQLFSSSANAQMTLSATELFKQPAVAELAQVGSGSLEFLAEKRPPIDAPIYSNTQIKSLSFIQNPEETISAELGITADRLDSQTVGINSDLLIETDSHPNTLKAKINGEISENEEAYTYTLSLNSDVLDVNALLAVSDLVTQSANWDPDSEPAPEVESEQEPEPEPEPEKKKGIGNLFAGFNPGKLVSGLTKSINSSSEPDEPAPASRAPREPLNRAPDKQAFWAGAEGEGDAYIRQILLPMSLTAESFQANFRSSPEFISIDSLNSRIEGAPLDMNANVNFTEGRSNPYELDASLRLSDFDTTNLIWQGAPFFKDTFKGVVEMTATLETQAPNPDIMARRLQGTLDINSFGGYFNILGLGGEEVLKVAEIAGTAGTVAKIGKMFKSDIFGSKDEEVEKVLRIIDLLQGFQYEEFTLRASRGRDLRIRIEEAVFRSEGIVFDGRGFITLTEEMLYADEPMDIQFQLWLDGYAYDAFNAIGLVNKERENELGYRLGPMIRIQGTPSNPDWSDFISVLTRSLGI